MAYACLSVLASTVMRASVVCASAAMGDLLESHSLKPDAAKKDPKKMAAFIGAVFWERLKQAETLGQQGPGRPLGRDPHSRCQPMRDPLHMFCRSSSSFTDSIILTVAGLTVHIDVKLRCGDRTLQDFIQCMSWQSIVVMGDPTQVDAFKLNWHTTEITMSALTSHMHACFARGLDCLMPPNLRSVPVGSGRESHLAMKRCAAPLRAGRQRDLPA